MRVTYVQEQEYLTSADGADHLEAAVARAGVRADRVLAVPVLATRRVPAQALVDI